MKRVILIIILSTTLAVTRLSAPPSLTFEIIVGEAINPFLPIVDAIHAIESSCGVQLYNAREGATGDFGIRQVRLDDYNNRTGKTISLRDLNYETSKTILLYYITQEDYRDIKAIARNWNGKSKKNLYYKKLKKKLA